MPETYNRAKSMNFCFSKVYRSTENELGWVTKRSMTIGKAISREKDHWDESYVYCVVVWIPGVMGELIFPICSNADHHHILRHGESRRQKLPVPFLGGNLNEAHLKSVTDFIRGKKFKKMVLNSIQASKPKVGKVIADNMMKQFLSI